MLAYIERKETKQITADEQFRNAFIFIDKRYTKVVHTVTFDIRFELTRNHSLPLKKKNKQRREYKIISRNFPYVVISNYCFTSQCAHTVENCIRFTHDAFPNRERQFHVSVIYFRTVLCSIYAR